MLYQVILIIHIILSLSIIGLILMQHGKGADIGAAFGSGASNTIFGSQGTGNFLYKATMFLALLFCITSISLTAFIEKYDKSESGLNGVEKTFDLKGVEAAAKELDSKKQIKNSDVPVINESSNSVSEKK
tara:strand:- start:21993 stop:22382 length:390 start_codon:yes stop_codon:yes gene_type:complete